MYVPVIACDIHGYLSRKSYVHGSGTYEFAPADSGGGLDDPHGCCFCQSRWPSNLRAGF
jgi:hypothetical protein